jgi:hypothetical protein
MLIGRLPSRRWKNHQMHGKDHVIIDYVREICKYILIKNLVM